MLRRLWDLVLDRARAWRDRRLADPHFQNQAMGFVLTRMIARRHAGKLFDLCAGFVYSQVLTACAQLQVLERLAEGPVTLDQAARLFDLTPQAAKTLLEAATALDLCQRRSGGRYGLGLLGAVLLGNPGVRAMIRHHTHLYQDLIDPVAMLRAGPGGGRLSAFWPYASTAGHAALATSAVENYSDLMAVSQAMVAQNVLAAYSFAPHRHLLDVGGGVGAFAQAVAQRHPHIRITLFDLPAVVQSAESRLAANGLSARIATVGGNFHCDPLPTGADIISLVRVIHDHDDAAVVRLLAAAFSVLPPGGVILIAEPMAQTDHAAAMGAAYFGFYLFAMGSGRPRSAAELSDFLTNAGFEGVQPVPTALPLVVCLLTARRPSTSKIVSQT